MLKRKFKYERHSDVHHRQSRRRLRKRQSLALQCVGYTAVVLAPIFLLLAHVSEYARRDLMLRIAATYFIVGFTTLAVGKILRRSTHRRRREIDPDAAPPPHETVPQGDQGSVLVMVLVVLALLSGLALAAQLDARYAHEREDVRLRTFNLRLSATDAIRDALHQLADDEDLAVDHLDEPWAHSRETEDPLGVTARVTIVDENRYFDLNNLAITAPPTARPAAAIARDIFTLCGDFTPIARIASLRDWIDAGEDGPGEAYAYRTERPAYRPPDRTIIGWSEVLHAHEFTAALFVRHPPLEINGPFGGNLVDTITFVPGPRQRFLPLNVNTAEEPALYGVLGIGRDGLLSRLLERRLLQPFRGLDAAQLSLDPDVMQALAPYLSVRSSHFRVIASAYRGGHSATIRCLAERSPEGDVKVLQWVY